MSERENIFARIREALSIKAPLPGHVHETVPGLQRPSSEFRKWLPPVGDSFAARLELFRQNALALRADFHFLADRDELASRLLELRESEKWIRVGTHTGKYTDFAVSKLELPVCRTDNSYDVADLESCSVGITECDALIAQTGSILVTSRSAGGRALSVLSPHHVVLARSEQLLGDLPEAFTCLKKAYAPNYPSFISLITGPSRTGDIERILVLGAHGPKKLTILCLQDSAKLPR
jgi:L-lactate dehydrogenase complex protein LldG